MSIKPKDAEEADRYKPGPWAKSVNDIATIEEAIAEIAGEAEHSAFVASALNGDEGLLWCTREFWRIKTIAKKFAAEQVSA